MFSVISTDLPRLSMIYEKRRKKRERDKKKIIIIIRLNSFQSYFYSKFIGEIHFE